MSSNQIESKDLNKKRALAIILIELLFILMVSIPNIVLLCNWAPNLVSESKLQSHLLRGSGIFIDAAKYYACAQIAKTDPANIWNLTSQQNWFKENLNLPKNIDLYASEQLSPAQYTPQSIMLFTPLSYLPMNDAIAIFEIISLLFLLIPVTLLLIKHSPIRKSEIILWWLIVLAAAPSAENFSLGQINGYIAGLAAIFLLNWQSKNNFLAALSLALTIAIKPHRAFVLLIMTLATKKFNLLLKTLAISAVLLGLAAACFGIETVLKYPSALLSIEMALDRRELIAPVGLVVSILGPISILFGRHAARVCSLPLLIICLSLIFLIWRRALALGKETYPYAYTASFLCNLILGPHEHFYDLLLLSVAWAMTTPAVNLDKALQIKDKTIKLWTGLFWLFPAISWLIYLIFSKPPNDYFGSAHLPILVLMFVIIWRAFNQAKPTVLPVKRAD